MPVHGATNRRRVLSLAGGAILAGLGRCLGEGPPESMPESNDAPESATETGVDGTTPEFEPGTEIDRDLIPRAEFDCATMGDSMVRDDARDRPFSCSRSIDPTAGFGTYGTRHRRTKSC